MAATLDRSHKCWHEKCTPAWDAEAIKTMSADEIRKKYPRFMGSCPDCHENVIVYACYEQYIYGDY